MLLTQTLAGSQAGGLDNAICYTEFILNSFDSLDEQL